MSGYVIEYYDIDGVRQRTWMDEPMVSPGIVKSGKPIDLVLLMFRFAHPEAVDVISIKPCTLDDFTKMND